MHKLKERGINTHRHALGFVRVLASAFGPAQSVPNLLEAYPLLKAWLRVCLCLQCLRHNRKIG